MNIECERDKTIFRFDNDGRTYYSIGLSKKNQDGTYTSGYMTCRFKKDVELNNQTKIKIKKAWLDFYLVDKVTHPYIFISEFEIANEETKVPQNIKTDYQDTIVIDDKDLPF